MISVLKKSNAIAPCRDLIDARQAVAPADISAARLRIGCNRPAAVQDLCKIVNSRDVCINDLGAALFRQLCGFARQVDRCIFDHVFLTADHFLPPHFEQNRARTDAIFFLGPFGE